MHRLQIYIDESLDSALAREAERRGTSKADLVRQAVAKQLIPNPVTDEDPWAAMTGWITDGAVDDIDEYLYGDRAEP